MRIPSERIRHCRRLTSARVTHRRTGAGKAELDAVQARQKAKWETMTTGQKISDFAKRHEYGIILTSWATALVGSFTYIMRDPYVQWLNDT